MLNSQIKSFILTSIILCLCVLTLCHSNDQSEETSEESINSKPTENQEEVVGDGVNENIDSNKTEKEKDKSEDSEKESDPPPFQDLYCGDMNCYDLLGVTRDSNTREITKAYRKLALKWHPDRYQGQAEKQEAQNMFMKIAAGYEVLKDEESRKDYDYMMDHPEETYGNYYRYYRRRLAPRIDIRLVLVSLITILSLVQYYSAWYNHTETIKYLATVPKYRIQALTIARETLMLKTGRVKGVTKDEQKRREEAAIRDVISDLMDQNGGYPRPEVSQVLWMQIIRLPVTLYSSLRFWTSWIWRFYILRQEYGDPEKEFIVRRRLGMTEKQWMSLDEEGRARYLDRRLWEASAWQEWEEERLEQERLRHAMSGRSKQERRWEKRGDNRMTFDENYDWE